VAVVTLCRKPFSSCKALWEPELLGNRGEIPTPAWWRPPPVWKLQQKPIYPIHPITSGEQGTSELRRSKERRKGNEAQKS